MNKSKIEWTDYTWNPIKGICPVGCWYCYARKIYKRFGMNPKVRYIFDEPGSLSYIEKLQGFNPKPKSKIFVCSTFEIFHPVVKKKWRDEIFQLIEKNSKYIFQILTKMPENIDRPMPDNVWLGTSIVKKIECHPKIEALYNAKAKLKFISFEPLLEDVSAFQFQGYLGGRIGWVIIGKITGHGKKYNPEREWIAKMVEYWRSKKIPIFMKNNLKDIWGETLIQEWPEG